MVVQARSPDTATIDTGGNLADYFHVASVARNLVVSNGPITLDPPGIVVTVEEFYGG